MPPSGDGAPWGPCTTSVAGGRRPTRTAARQRTQNPTPSRMRSRTSSRRARRPVPFSCSLTLRRRSALSAGDGRSSSFAINRSLQLAQRLGFVYRDTAFHHVSGESNLADSLSRGLGMGCTAEAAVASLCDLVDGLAR
eukprot:PhM_4_TR10081/c0_g1_i3/m.75705